MGVLKVRDTMGVLKVGCPEGENCRSVLAYYIETAFTEDHFNLSCNFLLSYRSDSWVRLVSPPYRGSALVVIDGLVTSVGGYDSLQQDQDKLVSLVDGKWSEHYPAMPTPRHYAMATMLGHTLIVAGGSVKNNVRVSTVEVMDSNERVWHRVANLPTALSSSHFSVCGNEVYLVGGYNANGDAMSSILACNGRELLGQTSPPPDSEQDSIRGEAMGAEQQPRATTPSSPATPSLPETPTSTLPATPNSPATSSPSATPTAPATPTTPATPTSPSATPTKSKKQLKRASTNPTPLVPSSPWRLLLDTPPITLATSCIVNQHLVILGGLKKSSKRPSGDIFRHDPQTGGWEVVGSLPTARYCSSAAAMNHGELMVVGGVSGQPGGSEVMNLVEVAMF